MKVLDDRVRDVLRVKFELGLFDRPYVDPAKADAAIMMPESMATSLRASRESIVLLKNEAPSRARREDRRHQAAALQHIRYA